MQFHNVKHKKDQEKEEATQRQTLKLAGYITEIIVIQNSMHSCNTL